MSQPGLPHVPNVASPAAARSIAITNVRIVDGNGGVPIERGTIVISGTKIAAVGDAASVSVPSGSHSIDGRGMTAMPGLNDMHVHVPGAFKYRAFLDANLYAGVTTLLDTGNKGDFIFDLRSEIAQGHVWGPRLYAVGPIVDSADPYSPAGAIAVVSKDQVPRYIKWLADRKPDMIKLYNSLSDRLVNALAMEGKKYGLRSIIDQWDRDGSTDLTRSGIAGYAHMPIRELSDDEVTALSQYNVFFITTLTVIDENVGRRWLKGPSVLDDPLVMNTVSETERDLWRASYGKLTPEQFEALAFDTVDMPGVLRNVRKLLDAGVVMAIGSDALQRGVFPGDSVHREMELMVEGGATPLEAITAATKNGAVIMNATQEWGTLAPGRDADVLLADGKPDQTISDTRKIHMLMMGGTIVDRAKLRIDPKSSEVRWYSPPPVGRYSKWWHYPNP